MRVADPHADVAAQEGGSQTAGAGLVAGDLIGGAGMNIAAGEAADEGQLAELARRQKLLRITVEAIRKEEDRLIGLVAQCQLGEAGGRLTAGLGIAWEPMCFGLEVAAEQGEGDASAFESRRW